MASFPNSVGYLIISSDDLYLCACLDWTEELDLAMAFRMDRAARILRRLAKLRVACYALRVRILGVKSTAYSGAGRNGKVGWKCPGQSRLALEAAQNFLTQRTVLSRTRGEPNES